MDSNKIKKGLGRGLSSLIGETKVQMNINNSKNNNSKSVTTANVAIDDNSPVIQSLKGQATA